MNVHIRIDRQTDIIMVKHILENSRCESNTNGSLQCQWLHDILVSRSMKNKLCNVTVFLWSKICPSPIAFLECSCSSKFLVSCNCSLSFFSVKTYYTNPPRDFTGLRCNNKYKACHTKREKLMKPQNNFKCHKVMADFLSFSSKSLLMIVFFFLEFSNVYSDRQVATVRRNLLPVSSRQKVLPKRWYVSTKPHSATSHEAIIFIHTAVKNLKYDTIRY